ncbi:hypothetical protein YTPLAS72_00550 [Nitrospira sp.]|nr:hypothetical protein YTPLAS72_00550 [Nitrospira sp.]
MPNTNASFAPYTRSDAIKSQLDVLDSMDIQEPNQQELESFDTQTQEVLAKLYGESHQYLEVYKYATLGEAEALVNLPESAQEPQSRDREKKSLQQRRQALLGMLLEMQALEAQETKVLAGEDPPSL